jgi:hypothetical protein
MSTTTKILWIVYVAILAVLLPHTAWAFSSAEPSGSWFIPWAGAFGFEAAIAVLTYKWAEHIERKPKGMKPLRLWFHRYVNAFSLGLFGVTAVSMLANLSHAVEFSQSLKIFAEWGISPKVYSLAFGGILPLISLTFARVLSNVADDEDAPNPELEAANTKLREANRRAAESEHRAKSAEERVKATEDQARLLVQDAEERARLAEGREDAISDLVRRLFGDDKKQRILTARQTWPKMPNTYIAMVAEASPAYVSEVLNSTEAIDVTAEYTQVKQ